jgi:hypothetical protein
MVALALIVPLLLGLQTAVAPTPGNEHTNPIAQVALGEKSAVDIPSMDDPALVLPVVCSENEAVLFRTAAFGSISDVAAIARDGSQKASYKLSRANEITQPRAITFFPRGKYLYELVRGFRGGGERRTLRRPDGTTENQVTYERIAYYIVKYEENGDYRGSVELDIPFRPLQFGVFENGDFLIVGTTDDRQSARVALVQSSGQFIKLIELEGDAQLKTSDESDSPGTLPEKGKRLEEGFMGALHRSAIISAGPKLLIVRKGTNIPVFAVNPGGQVNAIKIDTPKNYRIEDIKVTPTYWVAIFTHRISDSGGVEFAMYAIDPESGKLLHTYAYSRFPGFGFACANDQEFTFLVNINHKLKLLTLQPSQR